jgi:hypothetical protein
MKKLYKVTVRGFIGNNEFYVLADNPDKAYTIVRNFLDKNAYGYDCDRELDSIILIASANKYDSIPMVFEENDND